MASDIQLDKLLVSAEKRALLEDMYRPNATSTGERMPVDHLFNLEADDQLNAAAIMVQHGLDLEAREDLSNRWAQQWARTGGGRPAKESPDSTNKILFLW
jgi:hypothetical protein